MWDRIVNILLNLMNIWSAISQSVHLAPDTLADPRFGGKVQTGVKFTVTESSRFCSYVCLFTISYV